MKVMTGVLTTMVFVLAFGLAYADDVITPGKDVGTVLYESAFPAGDITMAHKDFSRVPNVLEAQIEVGAIVNNTTYAKDEGMLDSEARGSAAGGMSTESELDRIWDKALGPGGSDLP
jgi:hypothetical protein